MGSLHLLLNAAGHPIYAGGVRAHVDDAGQLWRWRGWQLEHIGQLPPALLGASFKSVFKKAGKVVKKAAKRTGKGVSKVAKKAGKAVSKVAKKAGKAVKKGLPIIIPVALAVLTVVAPYVGAPLGVIYGAWKARADAVAAEREAEQQQRAAAEAAAAEQQSDGGLWSWLVGN